MFVGITDKLNNKIQYILMQESFYFVGLNTILSDLLLRRKRLIKLIMDWMILDRIGDAFNEWYWIGDSIVRRIQLMSSNVTLLDGWHLGKSSGAYVEVQSNKLPYKFNENNTRLHLFLYRSYVSLCRLMYCTHIQYKDTS